MTATEYRWWQENTTAGRESAKFKHPGPPTFEQVMAEVERADSEHQRIYGRNLTDSERLAVRIGAERTRPFFGHRGTLDRPDYDELGWGWTKEAKPEGRGSAYRDSDGWHGDPDVAARAAAAEERAAEAQRQAYGDPIYRGVG